MVLRMDNLILRTDASLRGMPTPAAQRLDMSAPALRAMYDAEIERLDTRYGEFLNAVNELLADDEELQ